MFLGRWKSGRAAVGLLVAAFLVLAGVNLAGLVKGERAIDDAKAKPCRVSVFGIDFEAGGRPSGTVGGCGDGAFHCIHIGWAPPQGGAARTTADW